MSTAPASSELTTLRQLTGATRNLTLFYLKKLEGADVRKHFEVEGKQLNSIYWLVAHLTWAENNLVLRSSGGPNPGIPWLKHFAIGKPAEEGETNGPSWEEALEGFHKVHEVAMAHLETLDPAKLDEPNAFNWEVPASGGSKTIRATLMHHIRHENSHAGHLGWLAKLNDRKTI